MSTSAPIKHSHTDVLIIGAGPAGLMLANTLATQGVTSFRIIDRRHDKIFTGQADGLQCRTLEVLHSFGMVEEIVRQACSMMEVYFWNPVERTLKKTGAIHANFVLGCDNAHSWTRKQIGGEMVGESTPHIWGVLDCIPATDFPDIRMRCAIHSEASGSVMVIPREDGMVHFYIQLSELYPGVDRTSISPEMILDAARKVMHPFTLEVSQRDIQW